MKPVLLLALGGAICAAALFTHSRSRSSEPVLHVRNTFTFTLPHSYATMFPLFGAARERVWSSGWHPAFLYPTPARDSAGMVFTVAHGYTRSVWVNTAFDTRTGHVQYVSVIPNALATLIDIQIQAIAPASTRVSVTYERTALVPEANDHVRALGDHDRAAGPQWETAIHDYLKRT